MRGTESDNTLFKVYDFCPQEAQLSYIFGPKFISERIKWLSLAGPASPLPTNVLLGMLFNLS